MSPRRHALATGLLMIVALAVSSCSTTASSVTTLLPSSATESTSKVTSTSSPTPDATSSEGVDSSPSDAPSASTGPKPDLFEFVDGDGYHWSMKFDVHFRVKGLDPSNSKPGYTSLLLDPWSMRGSVTNETEGHNLTIGGYQDFELIALYSAKSVVCEQSWPVVSTSGKYCGLVLADASNGLRLAKVAPFESVDLTVSSSSKDPATGLISIDDVPESKGPALAAAVEKPKNVILAVLNESGPTWIKFCAGSWSATGAHHDFFMLGSEKPLACGKIGQHLQ